MYLEIQCWIQRSISDHDETDPDDASLQEVKNTIEWAIFKSMKPFKCRGSREP